MNKDLTIIDFSHLSMRMLFTSISLTKPPKIKGKHPTEEYISYWKHLLFNNLSYLQKKFKGEIIIAVDGKNNWRKKYFNKYKLSRKKHRSESPVIWEDYYSELDEVIQKIDDYFPYKIVKYNKAEADDIAGVLSNKLGNKTNITLVTSDHDWEQCLVYNKVKLFDPIKKEYKNISTNDYKIYNTPKGEMCVFSIKHALKGDGGDDVPKLTEETELSDNFIAYLKENELYIDKASSFFNLNSDTIEKLINNYDVFKKYKSGKNKGKNKDEKDIFKTVNLGDKAIEKIVQSQESFNQFLESHELYNDYFKRNATLVDFQFIPEDTQEHILNSYNNAEIHYNPMQIFQYFIDEGLSELSGKCSDFYIGEPKSSLDDFL